MGKLSRRNLNALTNLVLGVAVISLACLCFIPQKIQPASTSAPYYNGDASSDKVSIMFNVYEGEEVVNGILDVLEKYGVKATFFFGGCFIDDRAELLKKVAEGGHEIGNHGYFHRDHKGLSHEENRQEIANTGKVITALVGVTPTLFAPPSGSFDSLTLSVAASLGYTTVMWSKDTIDWRDSDPAIIYSRATEGVRGGDLILAHPKAHTLRALPDILKFYAESGLKQVTVSQNLFGE